MAASALTPARLDAAKSAFRLRTILGSCLYGRTKLAEILPEVRKISAEHIDIWPERHGNQREQLDEMGQNTFAALLKKHDVKIGMLTRYDLGPFHLAYEMRVLKRLGGTVLITGAEGPRGLKGPKLKAAVKHFAEQMKRHTAVAEELDVTIGIENHRNNLMEPPDALLWFAEFATSKHAGIALAPYHLPQEPEAIGRLIVNLGPKLVHMYAWQHGKGCHQKLPKEEELLQMPGRGPMDFTPIVAALRHIDYQGWVEVFMHPVPRGIPILDTTASVTAEINRARAYLQSCLENT
jgi:sugar phosphate isomerase/epimerase